MTLGQQIPAILQRNSIILPKMICYVLVVLIALSSAKLVWSLVSSDDADQAPFVSQNTAPKLVAPPPPKPDYGAQIARLHLMGKATVVSNAPVVTENIQDTSLNLTLSGVLALGNGEGFAIIENQSNKHKFYQIDEEVTSGVTLHSVYADYVLLNRSGRNEKLSLPKAKQPSSGLVKVNTNTPRASSSRSLRNSVTRSAAPEPTLANLKQQLNKNPSSLAQHVAISAAQDDSGKFIGYKVKPNGPSSTLFNELGLVENDIVVSINNISLDNPNKATQAFQKLISASQLEMTVIREGTEINLLHNLE